MFTASDPFLGRLLAQRYRLVHLLGQGGMGRVYLAQDLLFGGVEVAVKLLSQPAMDRRTRLRFEREAKACAALGQKSLHIVKVNDYGITPDEVPFYVMEYLNGKTLKDILAAGALPLERFFRLARQIGLGLKAAHEGILMEGQRVQVIHRDLKPANVIVVADDSFGELAKLVDFGIAKLLNSHESLSFTHAYLGTLAYSSPEQLEGSPLDVRSDIYSFGIMLYQMVSGEMPLKPTTESFPGWYQAHHKRRPIPLEDLGLKFALPAGLSDLILSCLAKDPAARPQSVANVLTELEHIQARAQGSIAPQVPVASSEEAASGPLSGGLPAAAPSLVTAGTLRLRPLTAVAEVENGGSLLWVRLIPFLMGGLLGLTLVSWGWGRFLQRPSAPRVSGPGSRPAVADSTAPENVHPMPGELVPEPLVLASEQNGRRDPAPELEPYTRSEPLFRAFPLETSRETVRASLGSPNQQGHGAWPNTVYDLYRLGGVNLGLLYDASSLALRQTEATVTDGVPTPQVEGLLEDMLQAPLPAQLQRELQAVREGRSERVQFRVGPWAGRIERNAQGHLYMALWDPTLPSGAPPPSPSSPTLPPAAPVARPPKARNLNSAAGGPRPGQTMQELLRRARELRGD
ncbi:serine/threonine protein kinase [Synechococcus sp. R50.1]|uniref:serine/threonine-protein kinase n=1 Tax=Synechococcus sp. R50.1 TaxID=2969649 RepID=UPI0039C12BCB